MQSTLLAPTLLAPAPQPFRPRRPWLNGDLQTLRDSLRLQRLPRDLGQPQRFVLEGGDQLLGLLDLPIQSQCSALVVVVHGLAGGSDRIGPRRLALTLQQAGFAVLRLNLRGAGPGRALARGSYAAQCNRDLVPVLRQARRLAGGAPLLGAGISLGGTNLLNALLAPDVQSQRAPLLDGLVCISSPLDLQVCSRQIERPRNRIYERWLLRRLVAEVAADPCGLSNLERAALQRADLRSIRDFDAAITAPRWGYGSVDAYYREASPLPRLLARWRELPPSLFLHALDDPWVPAESAQALQQAVAAQRACGISVMLTQSGGHNGFHGVGDSAPGRCGCWSDRLTASWMQQQVCVQAGGQVALQPALLLSA